MDPINTAFDLAQKAYWLYQQGQKMANAPGAIRNLTLITESLHGELKWVEENTPREAQRDSHNYPDKWEELFKRKDDRWVEGPLLVKLKTSLGTLHVKFTRYKQEVGEEQVVKEKSKLKRFGNAMKEPLHTAFWTKAKRSAIYAFWNGKDGEEEVKSLSELMQHVRAIRDWATHDNSKYTRVLALQSAEIDRAKQEETRFLAILRWLSPVMSTKEHNDRLLKSGLPQDRLISSDWLRQDKVFQAWQQGRPWPMTFYGRPGSGKTVLCSQIIDYLRRQYTNDRGTAIIFAYLDHKRRKTQTKDSVLAALLKMIIEHRGPQDVPEAILSSFTFARERSHETPEPLTGDKVTEHLGCELNGLTKTYIIIDGLDEASDATRKELVRSLRDMLAKCNGKVSLLFSSRRLEKWEKDHRVICSGIRDDNSCATEIQDDGQLYYGGTHNYDKLGGGYLCGQCAASATSRLKSGPRFDSIDFEIKTPRAVTESFVLALMNYDMGEKLSPRDLQTFVDNASAKSNNDSDDSSDDDDYETLDTDETIARILRRNRRFVSMIVDTIVDRCDGLFQLAQLQWDYMKLHTSLSEVIQALETIPTSLEDIYAETMHRLTKYPVQPPQAQQVRRIVMWVAFAKGILTLRALRDALSIPAQELGGFEPHQQLQIHNPRTNGKEDKKDKASLVALTGGLVVVQPEDMTVVLAQRTAYEYFWKYENQMRWFGKKEATYMARCCLVVLSWPSLSEVCEDSKEAAGPKETDLIRKRAEKYPFAAYAAEFWGAHARSYQSDQAVAKSVKSLVGLAGNLLAAVQLGAYQEEIYRHQGLSARKGINALHVAAWFGLDTVIDELKKRDDFHPLNKPADNHTRWTPLMYACRGQHPKAVEQLSRYEIDPNFRDAKGLTALDHVALGTDLHQDDGQDQYTTIKALCSNKFVDKNTTDTRGRTALMLAATNGCTAAVKALIEYEDVDVNIQNRHGFSALTVAAWNGFADVVELLLVHRAHDISVNLANCVGKTPLHVASSNGHFHVVEVLLRHGADSSCEDDDGGTALRRAVDYGQSNVLDVFARNDYLVENKDSSGQGLLHAASINGQLAVARTLIERGFEVNERSNEGRTPLHEAGHGGHIEVAKLLLDHHADAHCTDNDGYTPAALAHTTGISDAVVNLLKVDGELLVEDKQLGACALARKGDVELLRERAAKENNDLLVADSSHTTALAIAVRHKHLECARIMLEEYSKRDKGIDLANKWGRTALHEAAGRNDIDMVKLLLSHEPLPSLDMKDLNNQTPLDIAIKWKNADISVELIEAGAEIKPHTLPPEHTMEVAIEKGRDVVVKRLTAAGIAVKNEHLAQASEAKRSEIVAHLRKVQTWGAARQTTGMKAAELGEALQDDDVILPSPPQGALQPEQWPAAPTEPLPDFSQLKSRKAQFKQREPALLA